MIFIFARKSGKPTKHLRKNSISSLSGQSQCKSITIRLTPSFKVPKQFGLLYNIWKNCENVFIDVHNVKYILSGTYFCPNSIKIEN